MPADINENKDADVQKQSEANECEEEEEKEKVMQEKKKMRGRIFRRMSAMYHEVVNSDSRLFPGKL